MIARVLLVLLVPAILAGALELIDRRRRAPRPIGYMPEGWTCQECDR